MRETIIALLKAVRPDIDLRDGSPMYIYLVDALTALAGNLVEKIEAGHELSVNDSADMFFVDEGSPTSAESTVRMYFRFPETLEYNAGSMNILSRSGATYTNKYPVSMKASYMAMYTDESYNYFDLTITGESPINTETELIWDGATENFSHIIITSIVSSGSLGISSTDLSVRVRRELALRNNISSPGVTAYLSNMFTSSLVDILVQGYLDPEMQRDIYGTLHLGGCVDVYVKGPYPDDKAYKFDCDELARETPFEITITDTTPFVLPHKSLVDCTVTSWARKGTTSGQPDYPVTFVDTTDYTVDLANGVITLSGMDLEDVAPFERIRTGTLPAGNPGLVAVGGVGHEREFATTDNYTFCDNILPGFLLSYDGSMYLVKSVTPAAIPAISGIITVDRDIVLAVPNPVIDIYLYEPVRILYTYIPLGVELSDLENPVLSLDAVNVLDPLTDEIIEETLVPMPGYGTGNYGLGGYGRGNVSGYEFHVDDENLRYSMYEEGFLEIPRDYYLERIGVDYSMDSFVSAVQDVLSANRPKAADLKAFAFIPCQVNMDLLVVDGTTDITSLRYMIWEMPGQMELTDIVHEMYNLGQDPVKWSDFYDRSTYKVWKRDGSYVSVIPDKDGIILLSSLAERFLPQSITSRTS